MDLKNIHYFFSVVGLNLDYVVLNVFGHVYYTIFNVGLYYVPSIKVISTNTLNKVINRILFESFVLLFHQPHS